MIAAGGRYDHQRSAAAASATHPRAAAPFARPSRTDRRIRRALIGSGPRTSQYPKAAPGDRPAIGLLQKCANNSACTPREFPRASTPRLWQMNEETSGRLRSRFRVIPSRRSAQMKSTRHLVVDQGTSNSNASLRAAFLSRVTMRSQPFHSAFCDQEMRQIQRGAPSRLQHRPHGFALFEFKNRQ